ncbi:hypothetical protein [Bacteroides sp.]|uniref:hypothetical protein n=1 Tax=Bacteroides sp. TaxID=29523 RepID=UPI0026DEF705|nr:hypothetical protein [Bacteroides sp.]
MKSQETMALKLMIKCIILVCCFMDFGLICEAHNLQGHNDELKQILFGQSSSSLTFKSENNFRLICEAVHLTVDYTNQEQGVRFYDNLKTNGVKDLPLLESISFAGNQYHQKYTHMGWEFYYGIGKMDKANWKARKDILLQTIDKICEFKKEERIKKDAFAALIYEIHILGDHIGDTESTRYTRIRLVSEPGYKGQVVSPTSDGPFNNMTLYTYMLYHIQRLFREQKNTYEYNEIVKFLERHKNEYLNSKNGEVSYDDVQFLANETKKVLVKYIPKLLEREPFFRRSFIR